MKKLMTTIFSVLCVLVFCVNSSQKVQAQLSVTEGAALGITPLQLVQQVLISGGVSVSNATFNGSSGTISSNMLGRFTTAGGATTQLGFNGGIIMASGAASTAIGPNTTESAGTAMATGSDPDLALLIPGYTVNDKAVLEFDFVPLSDTVSFRYVFASEEFDEYCNSTFNDVFGFFVSGPGISGPFSNNAINIALMPNNPANYVTIDNVCAAGATYSWLNSGGTYYQYDRLTTVYTAMCIVQPCKTYHIKLAVADAGDLAYDSGVFLEENSFISNGLYYTISYSSAVDTMAVEDCNDATLTFHLANIATSPVTIDYTVGGTAIEGVDYANIPNSVTIPTGQQTASIDINPILDASTEGAETVKIIFENTSCGTTDTAIIYIRDHKTLYLTPTPAVQICSGQPATIGVTVVGETSPIPVSYLWSGGAGNTASVVVNPTSTTMYYVTVTDACNYTAVESVNVIVIANQAPTNDNCANAINITSFPYTSAIVDNTCASDDGPTSSCDGPYKNVWWKVTGACNGPMTAITCTGNTNFDDEIAVFTGSCGSMTQVACNDNNGAGCSNNYAGVTWNATAGTVYYISVGSYSASSATGNLQLNITASSASIAPTHASVYPVTVCSGSPTTITLTASGGSLVTGGVVQWFTGSCGGTLIGTGNPLTIVTTQTSPTTYFVRYTDSCTTTSCASVTVF